MIRSAASQYFLKLVYESTHIQKTKRRDMEDKDTKTTEKLLPRAPRSLLSWSALNPFDHKDDLNKQLLVVDDVADRVEESDLESSRDLEDEMDDTPTSPSTGGKSNQLAVTLNFLNTIVGAGIVGLPYVFRIAGFYMVRFRRIRSPFFFRNNNKHTRYTGYYSTMSR